MAFFEDVVDLITDEIVTIGLSKNGTTEISGGGYAAQAVTYSAASSGAADIAATLEFDGPANDGPITHAILKRASGAWQFVALTSPVSFNSDGRMDITSGEISAALRS